MYLYAIISLLTAILPLATSSPALHHTRKAWSHTPHYVALTRLDKTESPKSDEKRSFSAVVRPTAQQTEYAVEVKFNGIPRYLRIDTGSSDSWMVKENFKCAGKDSSLCQFGTPYTGSVDPIKDEIFYIEYGSGEVVSGTFGYANVTVGGLTVKKQQVALVDKAEYSGDHISSGLIGLGPRSVTNAYPGNDPNKHPLDKVTRYSPLFETMYKKTASIDPVFSLALQRGSDGGYLAFGGLPPIDFDHDFASTKFKGLKYLGHRRPKRYYPIQPQSYELEGKVHKSSYTAIVDSGTYANRLPKAIADKIHAAFDPPARFNSALGLYFTSCNATVPKLGIGIGGKMFHMKPADLFPFFRNGNVCATSITRGFPGLKAVYPDGFFVLGVAFLHNVVAVFDVENEQMHFAPHNDY